MYYLEVVFIIVLLLTSWVIHKPQYHFIILLNVLCIGYIFSTRFSSQVFVNCWKFVTLVTQHLMVTVVSIFSVGTGTALTSQVDALLLPYVGNLVTWVWSGLQWHGVPITFCQKPSCFVIETCWCTYRQACLFLYAFILVSVQLFHNRHVRVCELLFSQWWLLKNGLLEWGAV